MRAVSLWVVAVLITVSLAAWQRISGPTYPVRGTVSVGGATISLELLRSGETGRPLPVEVNVPPGVEGDVVWRRYPSSDPWNVERLRSNGKLLRTELPSQLPAGKVEYQVRLREMAGPGRAFPDKPAVARFKGAVPEGVLVPHILAMFLAMAFAARAGLAALAGERSVAKLAWITLGLTVVGGFLFGPAVQKYAFGAWWTGVPFGWDLTDNKTLIAALVWAWAVWQLRRNPSARLAPGVAALVMLVVFSVPHSVWGSELKWDTAPQPQPTAAP
jgi:hypothetical protein